MAQENRDLNSKWNFTKRIHEERKDWKYKFLISCIACPGDNGLTPGCGGGWMTEGLSSSNEEHSKNSMQRCLDKKLTIFTVLMYSKSLKLKSIRKQGSVKLEALVDYYWCYKMRFPKLEDYSKYNCVGQ